MDQTGMPLVLERPTPSAGKRLDAGAARPRPTLSIGMPVFNGAPWIRESVESLLAQGFADFELIIVDNASTDGTEAICRQLVARDPRIRYYRNATNIGVHGNYDRVFALASGRYFKWASCSDVCQDGFLDRCVAVLERRPDVVLVYPKTLLISSPARIYTGYDEDVALDDDRPSGRYRRYLERVRLNHAMSGVIRAAALRRTALNLPLPGSDISMLAELALYGKFVEVPERLFHRRFDPATTGILMDASVSSDRVAAYAARPTTRSRIVLHLHRFVRVGRAPIGLWERLCAWAYLVRRLLRLRHGLVGRVLRAGGGGR
jgi:glycosyltransferase involved in cell wall biosynthesis